MKKIIVLIYSVFLSTTLCANKIEIVNLDTKDDVIENPCKTAIVVKQLNEIIQEEIKGKPLYGANNWQILKGFTAPEARKYCMDYVTEKVKDEANKDAIIEHIFSEKHFNTPNPNQFVSTAPVDDEEALWNIYDHGGYADSNLFNAFAYNLDPVKKNDKAREDPAIYLINPKLIEKFFYRKHKDNDDFKDKESLRASFNQNKRHEGQDFDSYYNEVFSTKYFGMPEGADERKEYFLTRDISFLTQKNIDAVYKAALQILEETKQDDNIVIFGNTPYFVGRAIKMILESNPKLKRNVIEFPFSGSPNRTRGAGNLPNLNDLVTPDRLAHLKDRLKKVGLMADNADEMLKKSTYFVDVFASASGPAYVVEVILKDFMKNKIEGIPDLRFIALNQFNVVDGDVRHKKIATENAMDGQEIMLSLPDLTKMHFKIPVKVTYMEGHGMFDNLPRDDLRVWPSYNAAFWNSQYDYLLTKKPTYLLQVMFEHFDTNIRHRMGE